MHCVIKMLLEIDSLDDPAARKVFRKISDGVVAAVGDKAAVRALKIVEDGTGRLIDRLEGTEEN